MSKIISPREAIERIDEGCTLAIGGFMGCGSPHALIDELVKSGKRGFTVICNDGSMPGGCLGEESYGVARLIYNRQVKKFITSHIGVNPVAGRLVRDGEMQVSFVPQGSLAEMLRAGGSGLGGVLTPTGIGTAVEDFEHVLGKITLEGREYLIERPLRADWAMLACHTADERGNCWYRGTQRNMNPLMAMAAHRVVMEAEHLVKPGGIEPENVHTSSIFVHWLTCSAPYLEKCGHKGGCGG